MQAGKISFLNAKLQTRYWRAELTKVGWQVQMLYRFRFIIFSVSKLGLNC